MLLVIDKTEIVNWKKSNKKNWIKLNLFWFILFCNFSKSKIKRLKLTNTKSNWKTECAILVHYTYKNLKYEIFLLMCFDHFVFLIIVTCWYEVWGWLTLSLMHSEMTRKSLRLLEALKVISLTSVNMLCFKRQMVIWSVPLDLKCWF